MTSITCEANEIGSVRWELKFKQDSQKRPHQEGEFLKT